jgi:hypothetical protein
MASAPYIRIIRGGTHADRCYSILILRNLFDKQKAIGGAQAFGVRGREISVHCSTDSLRECGSGACISPGHTCRQACATDQRNVGNQQSLLGHSPWHNAADDRVRLRLRYCRHQARRPLQETAARQLPICFVNSDRNRAAVQCKSRLLHSISTITILAFRDATPSRGFSVNSLSDLPKDRWPPSSGREAIR